MGRTSGEPNVVLVLVTQDTDGNLKTISPVALPSSNSNNNQSSSSRKGSRLWSRRNTSSSSTPSCSTSPRGSIAGIQLADILASTTNTNPVNNDNNNDDETSTLAKVPSVVQLASSSQQDNGQGMDYDVLSTSMASRGTQKSHGSFLRRTLSFRPHRLRKNRTLKTANTTTARSSSSVANIPNNNNNNSMTSGEEVSLLTMKQLLQQDDVDDDEAASTASSEQTPDSVVQEEMETASSPTILLRVPALPHKKNKKRKTKKQLSSSSSLSLAAFLPRTPRHVPEEEEEEEEEEEPVKQLQKEEEQPVATLKIELDNRYIEEEHPKEEKETEPDASLVEDKQSSVNHKDKNNSANETLQDDGVKPDVPSAEKDELVNKEQQEGHENGQEKVHDTSVKASTTTQEDKPKDREVQQEKESEPLKPALGTLKVEIDNRYIEGDLTKAQIALLFKQEEPVPVLIGGYLIEEENVNKDLENAEIGSKQDSIQDKGSPKVLMQEIRGTLKVEIDHKYIEGQVDTKFPVRVGRYLIEEETVAQADEEGESSLNELPNQAGEVLPQDQDAVKTKGLSHQQRSKEITFLKIELDGNEQQDEECKDSPKELGSLRVGSYLIEVEDVKVEDCESREDENIEAESIEVDNSCLSDETTPPLVREETYKKPVRVGNYFVELEDATVGEPEDTSDDALSPLVEDVPTDAKITTHELRGPVKVEVCTLSIEDDKSTCEVGLPEADRSGMFLCWDDIFSTLALSCSDGFTQFIKAFELPRLKVSVAYSNGDEYAYDLGAGNERAEHESAPSAAITDKTDSVSLHEPSDGDQDAFTVCEGANSDPRASDGDQEAFAVLHGANSDPRACPVF